MSHRFPNYPDRRSRFAVLVHDSSGHLLGWLPVDHFQGPRDDIAGAAIFLTREKATAFMDRMKRAYRGRKRSLSVWRLDNGAVK